MNPTDASHPFVTRLAPTPSGFLHAGNGTAFVLAWALARAFGGKILLRIDDLDAQRMRPEYIDDIFITLDWLGLDYDVGPHSTEDFFKRFSQHLRLDLYIEAIEKLIKTGLLYECQCSRRAIRIMSGDGLYPNTCRRNVLTSGARHKPETSWRINVESPTTVIGHEWLKGMQTFRVDTLMGDFVVFQKNGLPAYQIASLVDDAHYGINFIVRGNDLIASTVAQLFLAEKSGCNTFLDNIFFHHPLILDNEKSVKLSKSEGASSLQSWRLSQRSPVELYKKVGDWLNLPPDILSFITTPYDLVYAIREWHTCPV